MKLNNNNSIYLQPLRLFPCPWASGARTDWWRQSPASPASHHSNRSAAAWCSPPAASENSAYSSKILVTCLVFRCVNKKIKYIYIYVYVVFAVRWISFERDFVVLWQNREWSEYRQDLVQMTVVGPVFRSAVQAAVAGTLVLSVTLSDTCLTTTTPTT